MHPHTRRKTKKRLGRLTPRLNSAVPASAPAVPAAAPEADVHEDERAHLVDDLAYFHARRYRDAAPGDVRAEDVERADEEIAALCKGRTPG